MMDIPVSSRVAAVSIMAFPLSSSELIKTARSGVFATEPGVCSCWLSQAYGALNQKRTKTASMKDGRVALRQVPSLCDWQTLKVVLESQLAESFVAICENFVCGDPFENAFVGQATHFLGYESLVNPTRLNRLETLYVTGSFAFQSVLQMNGRQSPRKDAAKPRARWFRIAREVSLADKQQRKALPHDR